MSTNEPTRRRLLTTAAAGLAAGAAAVAAPGTATAAPGGSVLIGRTNDAGQDAGSTFLVTDSDRGHGLHVHQNGTAYGIWGVSVGGPGVVGRTENPDLTGVRGVNGATTAAGGCAVRAVGTLQHGLRADTSNAERWAAIAENLAVTPPAGAPAGGLLATGGPHGVGVHGRGTDGVIGEASSELGFGLVGKVAPGSTDGAALYARGPSILEGFTAVDGGIDTLGPQTYMDSAFLVPHPGGGDRYLQHAAVHSAERKNIYDGTVTLDAAGRATVPLPAYVSAVNGSFRYQLTPIGAPAPSLHVSREVAGNSFEVAGGGAGQEVCWSLTGVRTDRYAVDHPLQVEFGAVRASGVTGAALANRSPELRERRAARFAGFAGRPGEVPGGKG
ncbi:hypothetical protein [Saccharothrix syringae]|uniref:Uncharacterized protein n=1 Tax=Saccharothrix syringae TaxID=103733 RepID=A0A5Q0GZA7_SACSY|nr:hypothetical protein [Saccharothrix syringae]QFZ18870.1 hypothetical protein EKG83_16710 [Saccharothrix syringae]